MKPIKKYFMWIEELYSDQKDELLNGNSGKSDLEKPAWRVYVDSVLEQNTARREERKK